MLKPVVSRTLTRPEVNGHIPVQPLAALALIMLAVMVQCRSFRQSILCCDRCDRPNVSNEPRRPSVILGRPASAPLHVGPPFTFGRPSSSGDASGSLRQVSESHRCVANRARHTGTVGTTGGGLRPERSGQPRGARRSRQCSAELPQGRPRRDRSVRSRNTGSRRSTRVQQGC